MRLKFLSPETWAALVLREIRQMRKEVRYFMSTLAEQVTQLTQIQGDTLQALQVLGGDVQQLQDRAAALSQQLADLNAQIPQDLSPQINSANDILSGLTGLRTRLEGTAQTVSEGQPTDVAV